MLLGCCCYITMLLEIKQSYRRGLPSVVNEKAIVEVNLPLRSTGLDKS
jgi:hypothetical protein